MFKPSLYYSEKNRQVLSQFKGYYHNLVKDEASFYFEENISSDEFPVISPRNKRGFFTVDDNSLSGLFAKTKLCYIRNNHLYYAGEEIAGPFFPTINGERQFVSMGARLVVFPDKIYINTNDFTDYGSLEASFFYSGAECSLCRSDGELYDNYIVGAIPPEEPSDRDLWVDTSAIPNILKQYSAEADVWIEIEDNYIRITAPGIGKNFNKYDAVELSGFSDAGIDGSHIIYDKNDDYIVVVGILNQNLTIKNDIRAERKIPDMDFVCESANRLWGCNSQKNEIYSSKLGDPTNFNVFTGISTDSYAVSIGTDGDFTAAVPYKGYVMFFKEHCVHKIYGQNPPYTLTTSHIRGVQKGSSKSVCVLNETLYYKSPNSVCSYEGGVPVDISDALGNEYFSEAVGGVFLNKYFICMSDKNGNRNLFTYDDKRGVWHRESEIDIRDFATHNQNLYFIEKTKTTKRIGVVDIENKFGRFTGELNGYYTEDDFDWCAETGLWGLSLPQNKYYSNVILRAIAEKGSKIKISAQFNSDGKWIEQLSRNISGTGSFVFPFITPRCDHMRLKIEGKGKIKILSISREIEEGSELNV